MSEKPKCSQCHVRDVFSKGLCSGCYGKNWRKAREAAREAAIAEQLPARQLTNGVTEAELEPIVVDGEIIHDAPPSTHLTAINPLEMQAAQGDLKAHLGQKLTVIEREIVEANAALNEARRNGWAEGPLLYARNRLVDDETYYNKILAAVEAGHTIIPEFPIEVFAIRRNKPDASSNFGTYGREWSSQPAKADCAPVGVGEYRSPEAEVKPRTVENKSPGAQERGEPRWFTHWRRTGNPASDVQFPREAARAPVMAATATAMGDKVFDQMGICLPTANAARSAQRARRPDPLIIGQILRKSEGASQRCASFIIAWYLNLNDL